jgi:hypothetical protein
LFVPGGVDIPLSQGAEAETEMPFEGIGLDRDPEEELEDWEVPFSRLGSLTVMIIYLWSCWRYGFVMMVR